VDFVYLCGGFKVMMLTNRYIRFDWAIKRLLRNKANHDVLEGFLSVLLGEDVKIEKFLESEGNQETSDDKYNRVDILCENSKGELIIVEVQNERAYSYFHRMLYGASKAVTEYIELGQDYEMVRKVYSVNIVYFELGQGSDYVYHGKTEFYGIHDGDVLMLSKRQREMFDREKAGDVFPEYYVLKVNDFDSVVKTPLDEWIDFLKTGNIDDRYTAKGLPEAREKLRIDRLPDDERRAYIREMERRMVENDTMKSSYIDGKDDGRKEGLAEGIRQVALKMKQSGKSTVEISQMTGLDTNEIEKL
jgi:hypothetical protein